MFILLVSDRPFFINLQCCPVARAMRRDKCTRRKRKRLSAGAKRNGDRNGKSGEDDVEEDQEYA